MPQTLDQFAARAATLPGRLVEATPGAVRASGAVFEAAARSNIAAATGGDMRLSRVRSGRGAAISVELRVVGAGRTAAAHVVPQGPIMLIERPTSAHREPFRYVSQRTGGRKSYSMARRRKARRADVLYMPGIGFRRSANHPGTKGKQPVHRAFLTSRDEAARAGVTAYAAAVRNHLGGSS